MLTKKRNRTEVIEADEIRKPLTTEEISQLIKTPFTTDKTTCAFCKNEITISIKIVCLECKNTIYCLECLLNQRGVDENGKEYIHRHDYNVVDKLTMPFFTSEWNSKEEMMLIVGK